MESWFRVVVDHDGSVHYKHETYREGRTQDRVRSSTHTAFQHDVRGPTKVLWNPQTKREITVRLTDQEIAARSAEKAGRAGRATNQFLQYAARTQQQVWRESGTTLRVVICDTECGATLPTRRCMARNLAAKWEALTTAFSFAFRTSVPFDRRTALKVGGVGLLRLTMPRLLSAAGKSSIAPRAKSVIFLFQWGGPSHIDMFDRKPDAPDGVRSPLGEISTTLPGLKICEELPETARRMDKVTLIRSVTHTMKNHDSAGYYALTGCAPATDDQRLRDSPELFPAYGSVVDHLAPSGAGLPTFVSYPHVIRDGSITPGQHASFLGKRHDPLFFSDEKAKHRVIGRGGGAPPLPAASLAWVWSAFSCTIESDSS